MLSLRSRRIVAAALLAAAAWSTTGCSAAIASATGASRIEVTSNVPAAVLVDGREVGMTPLKIQPKPKELRAPMLISVVAEGYVPVTERVTRGPSWTIWLPFAGYMAGITMMVVGSIEDQFGDREYQSLVVPGAVLFGASLGDMIHGRITGANQTYSKTKINAVLQKEH